MAVLKYVTRGEQTAQGKQKAYFCAHPDDYGRYFEKISNEILNTLEKENNRNCAFFYLENANAERDDDFKFSFKEMNLIVMPVTTRLLTTKNPALDIEFRLAIENHIPILPIMTESKLDELFSSKCGDLKFIGKDLHKDEVISYEETLTRFLTSILISDELAEKIKRSREICDNPEDNYHIGLACLSGIDVPKDEERALALIPSAAEAGLTDAVKKLVSAKKATTEKNAPTTKVSVAARPSMPSVKLTELTTPVSRMTAMTLMGIIRVSKDLFISHLRSKREITIITTTAGSRVAACSGVQSPIRNLLLQHFLHYTKCGKSLQSGGV